MDFQLGIIAFAAALILLVAGIVTGFFAALFAYFATYPLIFFALLAIVVSGIAFYSGKGGYALLALGTGIILVGADFWLPPVSVTCSIPQEGTAIGFITQYPQQAFASDTAFCKVWLAETHFNPVLFTLNFGTVPTMEVILIVMAILILIVTAVAVLYFPEAWATVVTLFAILLVASVLYDGEPLGEVPITFLFILTYGIFAPALLLIGNVVQIIALRTLKG